MHSRRMFLALGAAASLAALVMSPIEARATAGADVLKGGGWHLVMYDESHVPHVIARGDDALMAIDAWHTGDRALSDVAFVDGVYVVPGGEQLRVFYHDLYRPYAAMQPDNGAGQVSGDRAQSVGKAGDLKAGLPGKVKSETPAGRAIDARKSTSWLRRVGPWFFRQPVPA